MRPFLTLLLLATEAAGHAIPAVESNELAARSTSTYRAPNGVQFAVETGFDHHGGDYKSVTAKSLNDCINVCSTQASCRAVSYSGKTCWLKSSVQPAVANSKVTNAVRSQYVPKPISCPADGSSRVKGPDGRTFTVQCGVDHPKGDIKHVQTLDFANCINLCDETSGCVAASFRSGTCYLKKSLQPAVAVSGASTAVLSSMVPSGPVFCPGPNGQVIKETSGRTFTVFCNSDRPGSDLANKAVANFGDCIAWCDETNGCAASVFHDGHCWLKSKVTSPTPRTNSQVAVLDSALSPPPSFCPSQNGKQIKESTGRSFTVACNVDRPGGDLASKSLHSFSACVTWCDQTSGCLAAAYHDGVCWLKKTLNKSTTRANGQVAVLSSKLPQTSTKVTSTSTKKTTTSTSTKKTTTTSSSTKKTTTTSTSSTLKTTSTTTKASSTSTSSQSSQTSTSTSASSSTSTVTSSSSTSPAATTGPADAASSSSSSSTSSGASTPSTDVPATTSSASTAESSADSTSTSTKDASTSVPDATSSSAATTTADDVTVTTDVPGSLDIPAGPLKLPAQPTVTLRPLAPPNVDVSSTDVIKPKEVSQLWFGNTNPPSDASDAVNAPTVRVNMTFQYPSVILDNSANILNIQCTSGTTLSASFNGADAYNAAKQSWAAAEGSSDKLIIVTADPGCSSDGHYVYFVASSISFNDGSKSVSCSGSAESVSDIAQEVGVDFGVIETAVPTLEANPELATAYGCTVPETSEVHGLPAIYCGPDFDLRLNNKLGYYSADDADIDATLAAIIPGVQASDVQTRALLERRCWPSIACKAIAWVDNTATKAYNAVADGAKAIGNDIANGAKSIGDQLAGIASDLGKDALKNLGNLGNTVLGMAKNFASGILAAAIFIVTGDYDRSFDFPISIAPPKSALDDSPWGDGFKFYTWTPDKGDYWNAQDAALDKIKGVVIGEADPEPGVEFWCVDCHVDGKLKLLGSASFSLTSGLTKAQLSLDGSLDAGLYLGMNAFAQWNPKKEYDFLSLGLPGLSIPDIFAIGPVLSLGISVDLDISAVGQYLVGADMQWTSISAKLDVLNPRSSSKSGWTPNIRDTVQADGSLTVNSTLGLPVSLGFGINILNGKYDKEIKLVDTPGIRASMEYDFTNEVNNGEVNTDPEDGCYGIHWSVGMVNTVVLDLSDIKQGTYTLDEYDAPVFASGCIGESLSIAPPATTVAPPSGGTTSVPPSGADCGSLSCPGNDGQTCTSSGAAFQISCGLIYADVLYRVARTNNAGACVNICASDDLCVGANFFGQMFGAMPDCMMYRGGAPSSAAPANIIWSYRKVSSPHKKRIQLLDRAPTTLTTIASISQTSAAGTVAGTATGTASGNVQAKILADTLTRTASPTPTDPATDTSVASVTASATATTATDASTGTATDAASTATSTSSPDGPHESKPVVLKDATGQLLINPHVNGSLFISAADSTVSMDSLTDGTTFMADLTRPLVTGDSASRILYYFPSTIAAVGASRLRLGTWDAIPLGAEMITLFPIETAAGATVLVPMDSKLNTFYPFVCDIKGQLNKIFLVSDKDSGAATLMDPDLEYTVVGGVAQTCVPLAMVAENLPGWSAPEATSTSTKATSSTATSTKATTTKATATITP
ncbi:hypothetical protein V8C26DRAFT_126624 [Trichoderma gracile]